jgi:hypothetical protein
MGANLKAVGMQDDPEIHVLSIKSIIIRPDLLQTREKLDPEIVALYAQWTRNGDPFPPVLVYQDPISKEYWLADGFHRVEARRKAGRKYAGTVRAIIRVGTITDALLDGIAANLDKTNIRKVTDEDRVTAVKKMIRNGAGEPGKGTWDWSDNEIGRVCGYSSRNSVRISRGRLLAAEGVPLPDRIYEFRDGAKTGATRPYCSRAGGVPAMTPRIGKKSVRVVSNGVQRCYANSDSARVAIDAAREARRDFSGMASRPRDFRLWLAARRVGALAMDMVHSWYAGSIVGDAAVYSIDEPTFDSVMIVIARSIFARAKLQGLRRTILIGYFSGTAASNVAADARGLGYEFMTPEEFVAEFGPKDDEDRDAEIRRLETERPTMDELLDSGEYEGPFPMEEVQERMSPKDAGETPPSEPPR